MIFSIAFISNAAVKNDKEISPCYVNISMYTTNLNASGFKSIFSVFVRTKKGKQQIINLF